MTSEAAYTIVCPGCGWVGVEADLTAASGFRDCPDCGYQNGMPPYRLLTVKELLEFPQEGDFNSVDLYEFLNSIKPYLQDVDPNPEPEHWK